MRFARDVATPALSVILKGDAAASAPKAEASKYERRRQVWRLLSDDVLLIRNAILAAAGSAMNDLALWTLW